MARAAQQHTSPVSPNRRLSSSQRLSNLQLASPPRNLDKQLPDLPLFDVPCFNSDFQLDTSVFLQGNGTSQTDNIKETSVPENPRLKITIPRSRTGPVVERPKSWLYGFTPSRDGQPEELQRPATAINLNKEQRLEPVPRRLTASASESLVSFARRSWISRTPSPRSSPNSPMSQTSTAKGQSKVKGLKKSLNRNDSPFSKPTPQAEEPSGRTTPKAFGRASEYFSKIMPKQTTLQPQTKIQDFVDSDNSCASSATSAIPVGPQSFESQTSSSMWSESNNTTPTTDDSSNEMVPVVRDVLWSSFKTLEIEFKSFPLKQTSSKIIQVQTQLLPFLRTTINHPSIKLLKPEDVDRRAVILNKWWSSILDLLELQGFQPVPGVDRPILLEAAILLMMRQEWRKTTSYFQPLAERSPSERVRGKAWTTSSQSTFDSVQSAMLDESAEHSVRTMFVSNLVKQMNLVVDKMSQRHAPLTLVNFAGKTCAYAFFFVPGVAEILVRLWGLTPELVRRVSDEFKLPRRDSGESDDIVALFPPKLAALGWTSPRTLWNSIKQIPKMSLLIARIKWTGPWVGRWKGHDTDLFFIFCKYFHILSEQFMPPGLPLIEKARSPGFILVQAQLLSILDSTIHRQSAMSNLHHLPIDDDVNGADASAMALSLPALNLMRDMSDNRVVALLRDILTDGAEELILARQTFAESFSALLQAATRKTSKFNNSAALTLCDFLEEIMSTVNEFEGPHTTKSFIDWTFWFDVFEKMMSSMNTVTEVRMLSCLYTVWDIAAKDPRRKASLCFDWLLSEETFNAMFNNWCPIVRGYYQRLLCWRICRDSEALNDVDKSILHLVRTRLNSVWAHYLYMNQCALDAGRAGPSTVAMSPTLGKRFIILRQEATQPQTGLFMGFDSFARGSGYGSKGVLETVPNVDNLSTPKSDAKKRWSLLGKVLSITAGAALEDVVPPTTTTSNRPTSRESTRLDNTNKYRARQGLQEPTLTPKASKFDGPSPVPDSRSLTPPVVAEEPKYVFKFVLGWQQQASMASRARVLSPPQLPSPSQARLDSLCLSERLVETPRGTQISRDAVIVGPVGSSLNGAQTSILRQGLSQPLSGSPSRVGEGKLAAPGEAQPAQNLRSSVSSEANGTSVASSPRKRDMTAPVKPAGAFVRNAVYSGQALAEWSQVISECNSFIARRLDEGIESPEQVEVPLLGVEGFRRLGG